MAQLGEAVTLRKPDPKLIEELERQLEAAKAGELRGLLFVAYRNGTDVMRFGNVGDYSLADFALGLKLMELELDSIVTRGNDPEATT